MYRLHVQSYLQLQLSNKDTGGGVTGGGGGGVRVRGQSAPQRLLTGKFVLTYRENRGKEKSENGAEIRKI